MDAYFDGGGLSPYTCTDCCRGFTLVSGLFQHVESPSCNADFEGDIGALRDEIRDEVCRTACDAKPTGLCMSVYGARLKQASPINASCGYARVEIG